MLGRAEKKFTLSAEAPGMLPDAFSALLEGPLIGRAEKKFTLSADAPGMLPDALSVPPEGPLIEGTEKKSTLSTAAAGAPSDALGVMFVLPPPIRAVPAADTRYVDIWPFPLTSMVPLSVHSAWELSGSRLKVASDSWMAMGRPVDSILEAGR